MEYREQESGQAVVGRNAKPMLWLGSSLSVLSGCVSKCNPLWEWKLGLTKLGLVSSVDIGSKQSSGSPSMCESQWCCKKRDQRDTDLCAPLVSWHFFACIKIPSKPHLFIMQNLPESSICDRVPALLLCGTTICDHVSALLHCGTPFVTVCPICSAVGPPFVTAPLWDYSSITISMRPEEREEITSLHLF